MTGSYRSLRALSLILLATCAGDVDDNGLILLDLDVPAETSRRAEVRIEGNATAAVPTLWLEGVEIGTGERLTLELIDPDADPGTEVLGQAATVGQDDGAYQLPVLPTTLVIPLNDRGCQLLARQEKVQLALRVQTVGDRPPLRFARAYFDTGGE